MPEPDELTLFVLRLERAEVPYMVTGATAAILYGQPRVTNDLDVVLQLNDAGRGRLLAAFSGAEFYVPPESVIRTEQARFQRGHFNIIHLKTGYKADIYLVGFDPLHAWAFPLRRRVKWVSGVDLSVAPPEYVVIRKLEFYREGRSTKHLVDIRAIQRITGFDVTLLTPWINRLGLQEIWREAQAS
ncbi:MAG: hypothetical protein KBA71_11385 [Opitutaceae bacterium]|nr:hypothetical protein [Opitutaceae bacterium]